MTFHILDVLELQLARLERSQGADHYVINHVLDYLTVYPGRVHWPLERRIYRLASACGSAADRALLVDIDRQHPCISDETARLRHNVRAQRRCPMLPIDPLRDGAKALIAGMRAHMTTENDVVLPRIEQLVDAADLDAAWQTYRQEMAANARNIGGAEQALWRAVAWRCAAGSSLPHERGP